MRGLLLVLLSALAGCEGWLFKDYAQRRTSFIIESDACRIEVHDGNVEGGPVAGSPDAMDQHTMQPKLGSDK